MDPKLDQVTNESIAHLFKTLKVISAKLDVLLWLMSGVFTAVGCVAIAKANGWF
jgi:hypothetical protein